MIKQIWFVRNQRKLIDGLCFSVSLFSILYSALNLFAIADVLAKEKNINFLSVVLDNLNLLILPVFSLVVCTIIYFSKKRLKPVSNCKDTKKSALQIQFKCEALAATNLYLMVCGLFIEIDILSKFKNISGFGIFPIIIFSVALILYYILLIKKYLKN